MATEKARRDAARILRRTIEALRKMGGLKPGQHDYLKGQADGLELSAKRGRKESGRDSSC